MPLLPVSNWCSIIRVKSVWVRCHRKLLPGSLNGAPSAADPPWPVLPSPPLWYISWRIMACRPANFTTAVNSLFVTNPQKDRRCVWRYQQAQAGLAGASGTAGRQLACVYPLKYCVICSVFYTCNTGCPANPACSIPSARVLSALRSAFRVPTLLNKSRRQGAATAVPGNPEHSQLPHSGTW